MIPLRVKKTVPVASIAALVLVVGPAILALKAWLVMLCLGALHSVTGWQCHLGGFWAAVLIVLIASIAFSTADKDN